ncbi:MAG: Rrf2 family transcriptional regulator [Bacteroidota bacterium]|nr:Rrf2 family transcriptional regulator [Bacteroidota bacterium]MDP4204567.1 Rrf2 family transcriptional regulator [Bacteroidota bacterium]
MLSNTCKYALRALIYLAKNAGQDRKIGIKKISDDLEIPSPFLGKILQSLAKQRILASTKGPHGGFSLGTEPELISLHEIIHILDGDDFFNTCLIGMGDCHHDGSDSPRCPVHDRFVEIRGEMTQLFQDTTLKTILDDVEKYEGIIRF